MPRLILAVLLLLLPAGCLTYSVSPGKLSGIKTVGVVSALENKFTFKTVGYTVFGNDEKEVPINEPLGIDDFIAEQMTQMLGSRYDVRPVTYRKSAFPPEGETKQALRNDVTPQGLDAYVVVTPASSPYGYTNQSVVGLGIVSGHVRPFSLSLQHQLHALYFVSVYDGHTLERIGVARPPTDDSFLFPTIHGPSTFIEREPPSQI